MVGDLTDCERLRGEVLDDGTAGGVTQHVPRRFCFVSCHER
jgi:hypothetical protein